MSLEHDKEKIIAGWRKIKYKLDYTISEVGKADTYNEVITALMTIPMLSNEVNKQ